MISMEKEKEVWEDTERRSSDVKLSTYAPVTNECMDEK
jgi:hypothetical protein